MSAAGPPPAAPDVPPPAAPRPRRAWGALLQRWLVGTLQRLYALALIAVILFLSFRALWYLVDSLLFSPDVPAQVRDLPELVEDELGRSSSAFAGFAATERPRVSLSHYHRFGPWFQADPANDCTRSGCHGALPHHRHKESRAFLNLHATSLHCGVCHMQSEGTPLAMTWYDPESGAAAPPPAALRALAWLEEAVPRAAGGYTRADQRAITALLDEMQAGAASRELAALVRHLRAVRHDSADFAAFLAEARSVVPRHLRGEYGVKLALQNEFGAPLLAHPRSSRPVERFLEAGDTLSDVDRQALLGQVHSLRAAEPRTCTDCHTTDGAARIDFAALGYPPVRVDALTRPLLMQAIEHMMAGRPFHLPGFVNPAEEADDP